MAVASVGSVTNNMNLGRPPDVPGSGRIPDRTPRRVRYSVELYGQTGPVGTRRYSRRKWSGGSFDTVVRVVEYYGERADVQSIQIRRWPPRRA
jgi:hypothetical protein